MSCHIAPIINEHNQPDMVLSHQLCFRVQAAPWSWLQGEGGSEEVHFAPGKASVNLEVTESPFLSL